MNKGLATVIGADGFLGHYLVRALVKDGWRVRAAVRRPHTAQELRVCGSVGQVQLVQANVRYRDSVKKAVHGADAVINLAAVEYSKGRQSFNAVHNVAVQALGEICAEADIQNVVHVSALGAAIDAPSQFLKSKGEGEVALHRALPQADIVRPSVLFGKGDHFFRRFAAMANISPVLPMVGGGKTLLQPVYVDDVASHIVGCINRRSTGQIYELGGPQVYTFKQLMQFILNSIHKKRLLLPVPWGVASVLGIVFDVLNYMPILNLIMKPPITADQVRSLRLDNIVKRSADAKHLSQQVENLHANSINDSGYPGLIIDDPTPMSIEAIVPETLTPYRKYGQFYESPAELN